jgi:hypothetical protein
VQDHPRGYDVSHRQWIGEEVTADDRDAAGQTSLVDFTGSVWRALGGSKLVQRMYGFAAATIQDGFLVATPTSHKV